MQQITYIFCGILFAQGIYIGANWSQFRRREYITYLIYVVLLLAYFVFLGNYWLFGIKVNARQTEFMYRFVRGLAFTGYAVYTLFVIQFLQTRTELPRLHRLLRAMLGSFIFFSILFFLWEIPFGRSGVSTTIYLSLMPLVFASILYMVRLLLQQPRVLTKFILRGALSIAGGAFISNIWIIWVLVSGAVIVQWYVLPLMVGIVIEFYFLNNGLVEKSRRIEQQLLHERLEKARVEKQLMETRVQIAGDLHDDVGATLTSISLLSEVALQQNTEEQRKKAIQSIGAYAREMINNMSDIVWAIDPRNDSAVRLTDRMKNFAQNLAQGTNIRFGFHLPQEVPERDLGIEQRKNLFLIFKEAVNNAIKYAGGDEIKVTLKAGNGCMELWVEDNGKGFDDDKVSGDGNGLGNMRRRASEMGGTLVIDSRIGVGTCIYLKAPMGQQTLAGSTGHASGAKT